jgi:hypothetical protein
MTLINFAEPVPLLQESDEPRVEELNQAQSLTEQILHEVGQVPGGPRERLLLDPQPAILAPATPTPLPGEEEAWPQPCSGSAGPQVSQQIWFF